MSDDATTQPLALIGKPPSSADDAGGFSPFAKQLGPIRLIRRIGRGGMGEVWLGKHELLGRDVAVKFLLASAMDRNDPAFATFLQGARAAATVVHPGLNQIHHADVAAGAPYLVLELLDGHNLHELVERSGPLKLAAARAIIEGVSEAVAELHHRDLVHRDLKPSNFVLTSDGRVVVTDFGLACARSGARDASDSGIVAGTPAYMAPEMFDGTISARTDVYALGMSAYQLLCGRPAFRGGLDELRRQHREATIDVEPLRAAGVPAGVIDVIVRATTKDVLFRPKTARHLLDAFRAAFNAAGIRCASRQELMGVLTERIVEAGQLALTPVGPRYERYELLSALALRRRDRHRQVSRHGPSASEPGSPSDPGDQRGRSAERRRARWAGLIASVAGALAAVLVVRDITPVHPSSAEWLNEHLVHAKAVSSTGATVYLPMPIWAQLIRVAVPLIALTIGCLGISLPLYRRLRGRRLPDVTNGTRCGWCEHELRGITIPICSECGHRIGDSGPDEQGNVPLVLQRGHRLRVVIMLHVILLVAFGIIGMVTSAAIELGMRHFEIGTSLISESCTLGLSLFLALEVTLRSFEGNAQYVVAHSGRAWCRACQGELANLREPVCPNCGTKI